MMEAIHRRYEDTLKLVMGEGIMALFGAPPTREDHAVRACYAALTTPRSREQDRRRSQITTGGSRLQGGFRGRRVDDAGVSQGASGCPLHGPRDANER
jgi:class 3 adenylate cyclase